MNVCNFWCVFRSAWLNCHFVSIGSTRDQNDHFTGKQFDGKTLSEIVMVVVFRQGAIIPIFNKQKENKV